MAELLAQESANDQDHFYDVNRSGQTFTVGANPWSVESVELKLYRVGSPGTITVHLRATSDGKPTGADLASQTYDGDTLTTDDAGEWITFTFASAVDLDAETQYAITVDAASGVALQRGDWKKQSGDPLANGTNVYSSDSGSTWSVNNVSDNTFRVLGEEGSAGGGNTMLLASNF